MKKPVDGVGLQTPRSKFLSETGTYYVHKFVVFPAWEFKAPENFQDSESDASDQESENPYDDQEDTDEEKGRQNQRYTKKDWILAVVLSIIESYG